MSVDPETLERARQLIEAGDELSTIELITGRPDGVPTLGVVIKRTYDVVKGRCQLAPEEEQEPLFDEEHPYDDELEAPDASPIALVDDTAAFKAAVDVVLQGHAYARGAAEVTARLRMPGLDRSIRVVGDRRGQVDAAGRATMSAPEPFEQMPLTYERAYGGFDARGFERYGAPLFERIAKVRPEWNLLANTPLHYDRNPCGRGFCIDLDRESFDGRAMPNLEHPGEPLTPRRMAVGSVEGWIKGPLPACLDWQGGGWFPRIGYLGLTSPHEEGVTPAEVKRGWAAAAILSIAAIVEAPDRPPHPGYFQAASPGMTIPALAPGSPVELTHLHPKRHDHRFQLPAEVPSVTLRLATVGELELEPRLSSVVIRPDDDQVVVVWCARAASDAVIAPEEAAAPNMTLRWSE